VAQAEDRNWELANIIFALLAQYKAASTAAETAPTGPSDYALQEELKAAKAEIKRLQERVSGLETDLILAQTEHHRQTQRSGGSGLSQFDDGMSGTLPASDEKGLRAGRVGGTKKVKRANMNILHPTERRKKKRGAKIGEA